MTRKMTAGVPCRESIDKGFGFVDGALVALSVDVGFGCWRGVAWDVRSPRVAIGAAGYRARCPTGVLVVLAGSRGGRGVFLGALVVVAGRWLRNEELEGALHFVETFLEAFGVWSRLVGWRCGGGGVAEALDGRVVSEEEVDGRMDGFWVILVNVVGSEVVHERLAHVFALFHNSLDVAHGLNGWRVLAGIGVGDAAEDALVLDDEFTERGECVRCDAVGDEFLDLCLDEVDLRRLKWSTCAEL